MDRILASILPKSRRQRRRVIRPIPMEILSIVQILLRFSFFKSIKNRSNGFTNKGEGKK